MSEHRYCDAGHDVRDVVHGFLAKSPYLGGRNLRVEVEEDHVVLRGRVKTYYQKQLAQESIRSIKGVGGIRNELEVAPV